MNIGDRIKLKRKELKLRQSDLAKKVNVSSQVISNWERGYTTPDSEDVKNLAQALSVTTDYLHGLVETNENSEVDKSPIPQAVKAWLRADLDDLSENEQEALAEDLADYFALRKKRILEKKKKQN